MKQLSNGTMYECKFLNGVVYHIIYDGDVCKMFTDPVDFSHFMVSGERPDGGEIPCIVMRKDDLPMLFEHKIIDGHDAWMGEYAGIERFKLLETNSFVEYIDRLNFLFYDAVERSCAIEGIRSLSITQLDMAIRQLTNQSAVEFSYLDHYREEYYDFCIHMKAMRKAKMIKANIQLSGDDLEAYLHGIQFIAYEAVLADDEVAKYQEYIGLIVEYANDLA